MNAKVEAGAAPVPMNSLAMKHTMLLDQLINWSLANPGKPWGDAAVSFGINANWIRRLVSTDAFRARYQEAAGEVMTQVGIASLKEKVALAADLAVERLMEKIPLTDSIGQLSDTADMLLGHVYGKDIAPAPSQHVVVLQQTILAGRGEIVNRNQPTTIEGTPNA